MKEQLSAKAVATLIYINSRADDWEFSPSDIQERFNFGSHVWRKVAKEIRDTGLVHDVVERGHGGLITNRYMKIDRERLRSSLLLLINGDEL